MKKSKVKKVATKAFYLLTMYLLFVVCISCTTTSFALKKNSPSPQVTEKPQDQGQDVKAFVLSEIGELGKLLQEDALETSITLRHRVLYRHKFGPQDTLADAFRTNKLYVRFDPEELAQKKFSFPIFFATVDDLLSFLQDVMGLYVSEEEEGSFVVRECIEKVYVLPPGIKVSPREIALLMEHKDARVRVVKNLIYLYDNKRGHKRIAIYLKSLSKVQGIH